MGDELFNWFVIYGVLVNTDVSGFVFTFKVVFLFTIAWKYSEVLTSE